MPDAVLRAVRFALANAPYSLLDGVEASLGCLNHSPTRLPSGPHCHLSYSTGESHPPIAWYAPDASRADASGPGQYILHASLATYAASHVLRQTSLSLARPLQTDH